jgi:hypothetical protein
MPLLMDLQREQPPLLLQQQELHYQQLKVQQQSLPAQMAMQLPHYHGTKTLALTHQNWHGMAIA